MMNFMGNYNDSLSYQCGTQITGVDQESGLKTIHKIT